jgi:hypothetical protein
VPAVKYNWRTRFRRARFTVLAEEYRGGTTVAGLVQQVKNAAQKYAPGKRVRCRVTPEGDVVVRVERRVRLTPPPGGPHARRAA